MVGSYSGDLLDVHITPRRDGLADYPPHPYHTRSRARHRRASQHFLVVAGDNLHHHPQPRTPGYRCFNCRVYNHPCVALLDDQPRCVYCQSINRPCLPGPPITPVGLVPSWSTSRSPAPPTSVSIASSTLRTSPDVAALLSSFNLTLSDFQDFIQQRGSGSSSG